MTDYRLSHVGRQRGRLYDKRYQEGAENFYWKIFERPYLKKIFAQLGFVSTARYLDFAVGTGRVLEVAEPYFGELFGVDISKDMIEEARYKVPAAKLIRRDVTTEALDIGKFSVISCFRFILNAEPELREMTLRWIRDAIEKDGVLIINNHLNKWSITGIVCCISNYIRREKRHQVLSDRDVTKLMKQCGFRVYDQYGFWIIPAWRNKLMFASGVVRILELFAGRSPRIWRLAKDRIYVCKPV